MAKASFVSAASVAEASRLSRENPQAFFMAGGTDLLILKGNKLIHPQSILYLKNIPGLAEIRPEPNGGLRIGASATLDAVAKHPLIQQNYPLLAKATVEAVRHWRYRPTLLNGEPVEIITEITATFLLSER